MLLFSTVARRAAERRSPSAVLMVKGKFWAYTSVLTGALHVVHLPPNLLNGIPGWPLDHWKKSWKLCFWALIEMRTLLNRILMKCHGWHYLFMKENTRYSPYSALHVNHSVLHAANCNIHIAILAALATPMYMPNRFLPNSIIIAIILSTPWAVASTLILWTLANILKYACMVNQPTLNAICRNL